MAIEIAEYLAVLWVFIEGGTFQFIIDFSFIFDPFLDLSEVDYLIWFPGAGIAVQLWKNTTLSRLTLITVGLVDFIPFGILSVVHVHEESSPWKTTYDDIFL